MHKVNMLKAVYYLYTHVPNDRFDIRYWRARYKDIAPDFSNPVCETIGCACGHLTEIVPPEKIHRTPCGEIDFLDTVNDILKISIYQFSFIFSDEWTTLDKTMIGVCQRILYLLITDVPNLQVKYPHPYTKINVFKTYNLLKNQYEQND